MTECTNFVVRRDDFSRSHFETSEVGELREGQVLFSVDRFALTSNNITYAAAGDMLDYWGFFPAAEGFGRIPAMGYADVVESRHSQVAVGTRCFGFFPMASHLVVEADGVSPAGFVDGVAHRAKHAPAYRQYQPVTADPGYDAASEDATLLLRGLFLTSFLVDSFLADKDGFGASTYVIGSASSKTAIALASLLSARSAGRVVGITSPRNQEFVTSLGYCDEVLPYSDVKALPADVPTTFIDHSGDGGFIGDLHHHLGDALKYDCVVGLTHWDAGPRPEGLPGPTPTMFFAPGEIKNRVDAWGPEEFQRRLGAGWKRFCEGSDAWMRIRRGRGEADVERVYQLLLAGKAAPSEGHILSLREG